MEFKELSVIRSQKERSSLIKFGLARTSKETYSSEMFVQASKIKYSNSKQLWLTNFNTLSVVPVLARFKYLSGSFASLYFWISKRFLVRQKNDTITKKFVGAFQLWTVRNVQTNQIFAIINNWDQWSKGDIGITEIQTLDFLAVFN